MSDGGKAGEYEFTEEQNRVIADLARRMRFVGVVAPVFGVLTTVPEWFGRYGGMGRSDLTPILGERILAVVWIALGFWTVAASRSLRRVVTTKGKDITNLMNGMRSLDGIYGMLVMLGIVATGALLFAQAYSGHRAHP